MRVALIGTRGVPARYGGFETAVEEIGQRLARSGHEVVVYCRRLEDAAAERQGYPPDEYLGMRLVTLPAARRKTLETLSHTALSVLHVVTRRRRPDAAIVFNAANAPFLPLLAARRVPTAVHVDGLEWKRAKWGGAGRRFYRVAESLSVRWADALIADAEAIGTYYREEFGADTELLRYGAPLQEGVGSTRVAELGLEQHGYHLVVARFEPENHVREIVRGYTGSRARLPLVVVGSAPYADAYTDEVASLAKGDSRVRLLGPVWDQDQLDELYANALTYLHGHSVGGTNPSLLRAMGAGTAVIGFDVDFNREVAGTSARFFCSPEQLATAVEEAEADPGRTTAAGAELRRRAAADYRWDEVADGYETLLDNLRHGYSRRGRQSGRRSGRRS